MRHLRARVTVLRDCIVFGMSKSARLTRPAFELLLRAAKEIARLLHGMYVFYVCENSICVESPVPQSENRVFCFDGTGTLSVCTVYKMSFQSVYVLYRSTILVSTCTVQVHHFSQYMYCTGAPFRYQQESPPQSTQDESLH